MDRAIQKTGLDGSWTDKGGYVKEPVNFDHPNYIGLDPLFHWTAKCAKEAMLSLKNVDPKRIDLILANLSFPTEGMSKSFESVWFSQIGIPTEGGDSRNQMMSGLPAMMAADILGIREGFALDAACASAIYALKLGAIKLALHESDAILVGAVNRADPLFIHNGFSALQALSKTGQSRPFHPKANGLVPSEGCVFVALKRASDISDDDEVFGIIRSIGLSNDGRSKGFLAPSKQGQRSAIVSAFQNCDVSPKDVSFVECHATGTQLGDATEIEAMSAVYGDVDLGSHKSNLGHSITVSGLVATLKILGVFENEIVPPTIHLNAETTNQNVVIKEKKFVGNFCALSAFGFGGNNAHMILQTPSSWAMNKQSSPKRKKQSSLGVLAMEAIVADKIGLQDLQNEEIKPSPAIKFPLSSLRFPPNDLEQTTQQQLLVLKTAQMLVDGLPTQIDPQRTGVFIGMSCDADVTRFGARWRAEDHGIKSTDFDVDFAPLLTSAGVIGCMPNVVANRLNTQFDFKGPSFTVSSNSLSGLDAIESARLLIAAGDIDHAIVGSVFCGGPEEKVNSNTKNDACFLILLGDKNEKDSFIATLEKTTPTSKVENAYTNNTNRDFETLFRQLVRHSGLGKVDSIFPDDAQIEVTRMGQRRSYRISRGGSFVQKRVLLPDVCIIRGNDRLDILDKLKSRVFSENDQGPACLAMLTVGTQDEREALFQTAISRLEANPKDEAISSRVLSYHPKPIGGELAFVYTGSAAPSKHFYKEMLSTYRSLSAPIIEKVGPENAAKHLAWVFEENNNRFPTDPDSQIWSVSLASQIHTHLCRDIFGLKPDAAIGFSLGESSMLFSLDVWRDLEQMVDDLPTSEIFGEDLSGIYRAVKQSWGEDKITWANWTILGDVEQVQKATRHFERVHVSIINSLNECVISGDESECAECVSRLKRNHQCIATKQAYDIAIHVPEVNAIQDSYSELHRRKTYPNKNIRFYSNAINASYEVSQNSCSQMILDQANKTLDFPKTILQAYEDGVRIFLEQGPHQLCTQWIKNILGEREHIALSLNPVGGAAGTDWFRVATQLIAAGIEVDLDAIRDVFSALAPEEKSITFSPWKDVKLKNKTQRSTWRRPERLPLIPQTNYFQAKNEVPLAPQELRAVANSYDNSIQTPADAHRFFLQNQKNIYTTFLNHYQASQQLLQNALTGTIAQENLPEVIFEQEPVFVKPKTDSKKPIEPEILNETALSRQDLEFLSHGSIADVWGEIFRPIDHYDVVVRMPKGLLLLADRVTEINAEPGSMKPGNIHTETDVVADAWYLHCGRMPAGIMIESGQADLLLVSYLGVDLLNKGERAYRLLGCKLTYGEALPKVGETLHYDISIDGFAKHGDVRLFFFHYDCTVDSQTRLQVREGQAGFFTDAELAESGGVLWTPEESEFDATLAFQKGQQESKRTTFSKKQFSAFAEGDLYGCFGEDFSFGATHTRTPGIWKEENHRFLDEVVEIDFSGGPLSRGYLKATTTIRPDDWYFDGHFHNDPCMPGTLMFEGCLQAMTFFFAARGDTLKRDGWRTEPVPGMEFEMICRGQATPENKFLEYEIFIESAYLSPEGHPTLIADLLVTVDGLKAFHCRRMALRLVPDWPMTSMPMPEKTTHEIIPFDYPEMLATAIGQPSLAFGSLYQDFDGVKKAPRLPGAPYHFMTRVMKESGRNAMKVGATVTVEYDVPDNAWYFEHNDEMPFAVLLETGLQPCGWLASWVGCALNTKSEVFFRNLDGTGTVLNLVKPTDKVVTTHVVLTKLVRSGETTLVGFDVVMTVDGKPLYNLSTMFGFFPAEALASQAGLDAPIVPNISDWKEVPDVEIQKLLMVDEYANVENRILGRRRFHATDWFFKSHFFQDPVQPGSLGLEAMVQCLKVRAHERFGAKRFSTLLDVEHTWSYRGQVRPHNSETIVDVKIDHDDDKTMVGTAYLWTDGASIYSFTGFGISYE